MISRTSRQYEDYRTRGTPVARLKRLLFLVAVLFLLYAAISSLALQTVVAESEAMEPTISEGDRLLMIPLVYGPRIRLFQWQLPGIRDPERGDVVAMRPGYRDEAGFFTRLSTPFVRFFTANQSGFGDSPWESDVTIKRIIGLPGDTVRLERFTAYVMPADSSDFVSEFTLAGTEYRVTMDERPEGWQPLDPFGAAQTDVVVPEDSYFVLTDDRSSGTDSRHWGTVDREHFHSAIVLRIWPFSRFGRL